MPTLLLNRWIPRSALLCPQWILILRLILSVIVLIFLGNSTWLMLSLLNTWGNSKYFEIWNILLWIYENFEGGLVDTQKRQNLEQLFNRSERCLTCRHLQKTSRRQADDQFLAIPEGQIGDLDSTDPVKQTVSQDCLWRDLSRPRC